MLESQEIEQIEPPQAVELQRSGAVLLDVREDDEWAAGHAPDAVHLPLARVSEATSRFRGQEVLTLCRSGGRSGRAAQVLSDAGLSVRNVAGGMSAWSTAGLPVVRDDGSPGTVA